MALVDDVDYAGWAFKQGSKVRTWKKRFFVLRGCDLTYYETRGVLGRGQNEKGVVVVRAVDGRHAEDREPLLLIQCDKKSQPLKMKPVNVEEARMWVRKMEQAVAHEQRGVSYYSTSGIEDDLFEEDIDKENVGERNTDGSTFDFFDNYNEVEAYYRTEERDSYDYDAQSSLDSNRFFVDTNSSSVAIDLDDFDETQRQNQLDPHAQSLLEALAKEDWVFIQASDEPNAWRRRFAVLRGRFVSYYENRSSTEPLDTLKIRRITLSQARANALDLFTDEDSEEAALRLATETRSELVKWDRALAHNLHVPVLVRGYSDDEFDGYDSDENLRDTYASPRQQNQTPVTPTKPEGLTFAYSSSVPSSPAYNERVSFPYASPAVSPAHRAFASPAVSPAHRAFASPAASPAHRAYASSNPFPPASPARNFKAGWLLKEGYIIKSWKKRYFVLDEDTLTYSEKMGDVSKGSGVVFRVVKNSMPANSLDVHFLNGRILRISAENQAEVDAWFTVLQRAADISFRNGSENTGNQNPAASAQPSRPTHQHGWLLKKGQMLRNWKRRFFTLERNRLQYYATMGGELLGSGLVFDVSVGDLKPFCINIRFQNGRLLHVVAADEAEFSQWLSALQGASNISESFLSQRSSSQEKMMLLEQEFDRDVNDDFESEQSADEYPSYSAQSSLDDDSELGTGGFSMWTAAMKSQPKLDQKSSWDSDSEPDMANGGASSDLEDNNLEDEFGRISDVSDSSTTSQARGCSGWLRKESAMLKRWKPHYFTLHGVKLSCFKNEKGSLLESWEVRDVEEDTSTTYALAVTAASGKRVVLAAENNADYERWLLALWGVLADEQASRSSMELPRLSSDGQSSLLTSGTDLKGKSHSGWLEKEGRRFKTWKRRYFTFKNGALIYYNDVGGDAQGHGVVTGVQVDNTKPNTLSIQLQNNRILRVSAPTRAEVEEWYQAMAKNKLSITETVSSLPSDYDSVDGGANGKTKATLGDLNPSAPVVVVQNRERPNRFDSSDYFTNDTISNESFLRIRGRIDTELAATNGSFQRQPTFKGELNFAATLLQQKIEKEASTRSSPAVKPIRSDSEEDLEFIRELNEEDEGEEIKRRQFEEQLKAHEHKDHLTTDRCAACCVVM
ncbi:hypothetical protein Poli38472_002792 [Pythium oligandrum]|uniref:PH domain-containing protein n=1 Tax=Pythium oligandrum TaxID=41045 RepID=A0A8K1CJG8_PYTOL|nr:hypothetical protein Poli38472_002792 [Pythium oligandrum]|eukprot:TMW63851.1 hypothetical protein Poli38472_002792 [Pythium oligandrum]